MRISHNGNGWNGNGIEWECYRMGVDRIGMLQNGNDNIQNGNEDGVGMLQNGHDIYRMGMILNGNG
jgi:hypothetical protein